MARKRVAGNDPTGYAAIAGHSDDTVKARTGRDWAGWVKALDRMNAATKGHREIAAHVASLGASPWWSQSVAVGSERIRGLRAPGQRRDGAFDASKSRTFAVPVTTLFDTFATSRVRARWLPGVTVIASTRGRA